MMRPERISPGLGVEVTVGREAMGALEVLSVLCPGTKAVTGHAKLVDSLSTDISVCVSYTSIESKINLPIMVTE